MAEGTNSKQLLNQHGSIKVICNECGRAKEMEVKHYYKSGVRSNCCNATLSTVPMNKRQTHKNSRERKPRGGQKG